MILIVTCRNDVGTTFIMQELMKRNQKVVRFNSEDFPTKTLVQLEILSNGSSTSKISLPNQIDFLGEHVKAAVYRREEPPNLDPIIKDEFAITYSITECVGTLDALWASIPALWVNHPSKVIGVPTKPEQSRIAGKMGLRVPRTIVSVDPTALKDFFETCNGQVVAKQLGHSRGALEQLGGRLYTRKITLSDLQTIEQAKLSPTMFQELIPKKLEIRATVIGDEVWSVALHSQNNEKTSVDWRRGPVSDIPHEVFNLPPDIKTKLVQITKDIGLVYSGIDLILTPEGEFIFLEINPNGEYVWIEVLTGMPLTSALCDFLVSHS